MKVVWVAVFVYLGQLFQTSLSVRRQLNQQLMEFPTQNLSLMATYTQLMELPSQLYNYDQIISAQSIIEITSVESQFERENLAIHNGFVTQQNPPWHLDRIDQAQLPLDSEYSVDGLGSGVNVYIVSSGISNVHNEFKQYDDEDATRVLPFYNFEDPTNPKGAVDDCLGLGTHAAGLVGGLTFGVAKNVTLNAVRVFNCNGSTPLDSILRALDYVTENLEKPAIVLWLTFPTEVSQNDLKIAAIKKLNDKGVLVVVPSGNNNQNACGLSPASSPESLSVSSTDINDSRQMEEMFLLAANFGPCVDIFAPGSNVSSAWPLSDGNMRTLSGPNNAPSIVAGIAAVLLEQDPDVSPEEIISIIQEGGIEGVLDNVGQDSPNLLANVNFLGEKELVQPPSGEPLLPDAPSPEQRPSPLPSPQPQPQPQVSPNPPPVIPPIPDPPPPASPLPSPSPPSPLPPSPAQPSSPPSTPIPPPPPIFIQSPLLPSPQSPAPATQSPSPSLSPSPVVVSSPTTPQQRQLRASFYGIQMEFSSEGAFAADGEAWVVLDCEVPVRTEITIAAIKVEPAAVKVSKIIKFLDLSSYLLKVVAYSNFEGTVTISLKQTLMDDNMIEFAYPQPLKFKFQRRNLVVQTQVHEYVKRSDAQSIIIRPQSIEKQLLL